MGLDRGCTRPLWLARKTVRKARSSSVIQSNVYTAGIMRKLRIRQRMLQAQRNEALWFRTILYDAFKDRSVDVDDSVSVLLTESLQVE